MLADINAMIAEASALMDGGADPAAPPVQDLARRWMVMSRQITGGDAEIRARARASWNDAMEDPAVAARMARNRAVFRFVQQAIDHGNLEQPKGTQSTSASTSDVS